jgi:branched-chain amino acid transport system substrate-binding protein
MITRRATLRSLTTLLLTAACTSFLFSCGGGGGEGGSSTQAGGGDTLKIGSLQSTTGDTSTFGLSSNKGIDLAAGEQNAKGGVLGKKIQMVLADDQSQASQVRQAVLKLIEQDHVVAILGEVASGRTAAAAPDCQRNKIPLLSPASTRNDITDLGDYIFRSCYTDALQGKWVADYASQNLHLTRAALFTDSQNPYSVGLSKVIKAEFTKAGGTIVVDENYASGNQDFQSQLTNIRAGNPQIVFLPGYYTEVVKILPQARKLGINVPFIGGDGWDSDVTLKQGGDAVNGCYFTNHYAPDDPNPRVQEFVAKFKQHYNGEVPDAMAVLGYDAANILFAAIERAGSTDGEKIRDAIGQTKDFPGVTGNITIGADRNATKPGVVLQIDGGKLKMVARVGENAAASAPASAPAAH